MVVIDRILEEDRRAPRRQRHTARRVWQRLTQEWGAEIAEVTACRYVRERMRKSRAFRLGGVSCWHRRPGGPVDSKATTNAPTPSNTSPPGMPAGGCRGGRCESNNGIAAFMRLVDQVMAMGPYCSAPRVFWICDNGSAHRGDVAVRRLQDRYPNCIMVHTPVHASWLSQVESYFSIVQRKVLTPAAVHGLAELAARLLGFEVDYRCRQRPFPWKFTPQDFDRRLQELAA